MEDRSQSPLHRLASAAGRDFENLIRARDRTDSGLAGRRDRLTAIEHDEDACVVLMGSWGRAEVTGAATMTSCCWSTIRSGQTSRRVSRQFWRRSTGRRDRGTSLACPCSATNSSYIGLDRDSNKNLTRRMLFLLESVPMTATEVYSTAFGRILTSYLDESVKDFRPPRFLLNDVVRYWRTMCVDFAGKERDGRENWGLRNAKLRTSRKILFAGGLLPVLGCAGLERDEMSAFLTDQFGMPPTDRIAHAFLEHRAVDSGARALGAYDEFIGHLDDFGFRDALGAVSRESARESEAFGEACRLAQESEAGLLALLFETETMPRLVRDYAIF